VYRTLAKIAILEKRVVFTGLIHPPAAMI